MIREVIVVEGRSDTLAVKRAVEADTIETGGSAISEDILDQIRLARAKRGVIIFTDPDFPGEKIRKTISQEVPGCKHAFITREEGEGKRNLGVENASPEVIRRALAEVRTEVEGGEELIPYRKLVEAGLVGGTGARDRRIRLGNRLGIGYANASQLHKRLTMFQITPDEFDQAVAWLDQEENRQ